ncbi:hypothetical protein JCM3766R1_002021 [Sporobolomyces carnicolor]
MSEVEFALLIYSKKCQFCDEDRSWTREEHLFLRVRCCSSCFSSRAVGDDELESMIPDLHAAATQCVRSYTRPSKSGVPTLIALPDFRFVGFYDPANPPITWLRSDLEAVDAQLKSLEAEDELLESDDLDRAEPCATNDVEPEEDAASQVERFIQERKRWVEAEQQGSRDFAANHKRLVAKKKQEDLNKDE